MVELLGVLHEEVDDKEDEEEGGHGQVADGQDAEVAGGGKMREEGGRARGVWARATAGQPASWPCKLGACPRKSLLPTLQATAASPKPSHTQQGTEPARHPVAPARAAAPGRPPVPPQRHAPEPLLQRAFVVQEGGLEAEVVVKHGVQHAPAEGGRECVCGWGGWGGVGGEQESVWVLTSGLEGSGVWVGGWAGRKREAQAEEREAAGDERRQE